ncbi:MAG: response regulator [Brevundimonas sp.]|nr:MAG: response regulator [Brevundimonas sp.]
MTARILIVEDEAIVAAELRYMLEDLGYEVAGVAADTTDALGYVRTADVDLALVDVHLSDGPTGPALGSKLAECGVTVVYLTANPGMVKGGNPAAIGVLGKPTDEAVVSSTVAYALARRGGVATMPSPPGLKLLN